MWGRPLVYHCQFSSTVLAMKGSKDGVYLTPIRHRESQIVYRNGYFDRVMRQWHAVDAEGNTYIYDMLDCEFVFPDDHKGVQA